MKESAAANKRYNDRIAEQKRKQRAKEKAARDKAKAEERVAIDERKAKRACQKQARDAEKALKLSQRGNHITSKASAVKQKPARRAVGARRGT
jgi:hypothetical protein